MYVYMIYVDIYVCIYTYIHIIYIYICTHFHLICSSIVTFIIFCHTVCFPMLFMTKFLTVS